MVNQQKSKCQLRLEARSLAYQQKQHQQTSTHSANSATTSQQPYAERIQRATETRILAQRQRRAHARARVLHAKRVAAETWAKRREEVSKSRVAAREKLEIANLRREDAIQKLQESCKRRVDAVLEKVESMKEIQRYREARQRRVLETQLVDAARRRDEQTQKMVRRLSQRWQCVETVKDRVLRAKFIQRWYRRHVDARKAAKRLQLVKNHMETLVKSWQRVSKCQFDDSIVVMQQRDLARAAQSVLRVLLPSSGATGDQSPVAAGMSPRSSKSAPFRVLLMVGMLAAHPNEIMESNHCNRLVFAAKAVRRDMESILLCLLDEQALETQARALKHVVSQLEARFAFYFECFSLWKDRDAERLAQEMLRSYHDIYKTKCYYVKQEINHEADGLHELIAQTEKQLVQLRGAIAQVIGKEEALQRIAAIEQSCGSDSGGSSQSSSSSDEEMEKEAEPSPERPRRRGDATSNSKTTTPSVQKLQPEVPPTARMAPPPPPQSSQVAALLADEKLVHELLLNPSFRLPSTTSSNDSDDSLAGRVRVQMVKAFWDHAVAANDIATLVRHLEELRGSFASIVKARSDLVDSVAQALDPMALERLLAQPQAHFQELHGRCMRVLQAIRDAEAPARNDTTSGFMTSFNMWFASLVSGDPKAPPAIRILVDFVAFAMDKMDQIRNDSLNAHLGLLATYLGRYGKDYEQQKFHGKLAAGMSFPLTEKWLEMEIQARFPRFPEETKIQLQEGHAKAFSHVFRTSMLALVTNYIDGTAGVWPETFALDTDRIRGFRDAMDRMALISTMLVVLQEFVARNNSSSRGRRLMVEPRQFFAGLGSDLSVLLQSPGVTGSHLVARAMDELQRCSQPVVAGDRTKEEEDAEWQALAQRVHGSFQPGNPVFALFAKRIASAMESTTVAGQWEMHASLAPFETELQALAKEMHKLFKHNEGVHATLYNAVVKKAVAATLKEQ